MTHDEVEEFERRLAEGAVGLFPADTVYGLAADPESKPAVARLYEIKQRPPMPSAVMFFSLGRVLDAFPELGPRTCGALERLLPGPFTCVVPNPRHRFPLACGDRPDCLGLRVPHLEGLLEPMQRIANPLLQSSANVHGGADARRLVDVAKEVRQLVDVELDGGELPGTPSTVVDLCDYEHNGEYAILREGAVTAAELERALT